MLAKRSMQHSLNWRKHSNGEAVGQIGVGDGRLRPWARLHQKRILLPYILYVIYNIFCMFLWKILSPPCHIPI